MKDLTFSVIMPCYNSEAYVAKAMESVVNQTYPFWELIVINDGSYDDTLNIVSEYAQKDKRIKVFSKENGGYATAVNYGLAHIGGDYFLFLGSDDYLDVRLFEKLNEYFVDYQVQPDMVAFRTRVVLEGGRVGSVERCTRYEKPLLTRATFKEFTIEDPENAAIFSVRDTSRCYKTELLGDTRYFGKTGIDADGIFSMLISHKAHTFMNLPIDGYFWYIRSGSVSSSMSLKKHIDRINNWHKFFEVIADMYEQEITPTEKEYLGAQSHFIVELASSPVNALRHWLFIRREAVFCIRIAKKLDVTLLRYIKIVAKTPFLYSLAYCLRSVVKRDFTTGRTQDEQVLK